MPDQDPTSLARDNEALRRQLAEAQATLDAIGSGEVDAVVIRQGQLNQVFTLDGAERPYRVFVDAMQQGAVTLGQGGTVLYCNQRFAHLLQIPLWDLTGSRFEEHLATSSRAAWSALLGEAVQGRAAGEVVLQRGDGSLLPAFAALSVLPSPEGQSYAVVVSDLTEQKQFERLVAAERQLQEAARAKDHFIAMLGHELRNPLAPIRHAMALLKELSPDPPGPEGLPARRARGILERQVVQLTRLVDDLLDVARMANGKITLRCEELDLAAVVGAVVSDQRPLLEAHGLEVRFRLPERAMPAFADGVRVAQIVTNLLANAAKFTDAGGRVEVGLDLTADGHVAITVQDSGVGMDPTLLEHLFEPFFQARQDFDRSSGGLGLGLALAKGLVDLHGGEIRARSGGPGQGSTLTVSLPVRVPGSAPGGGAPQAVAPPPPRTRRILIIEDNLDAAVVLKMLLDFLGHSVTMAHTGPEGLAQARLGHPEVILCDIGLPGGMDGYAVAAAVRKQPDLDGTCLIAMTGFSQEEDLRRAFEAGFDCHLPKPADPEALARLLVSIERNPSQARPEP
jgi:signal transduction histidine kinase/ActR/RegA family two-component response regulator